MMRFNFISLLVAVVVIAVGGFADVPKLINYQGLLTDTSGAPIKDSAYSVTFTIYDASSGGTNLWTEVQLIRTADGLFSVHLGAVNSLADSVFSSDTRYLGIKLNPNAEFSPRDRIVSTAYSYRVGTVDGATGGYVYGPTVIFGSGPADFLDLGVGDPNVAFELRSGTFGGDPYIDFVNDAAEDFDARIQLNGEKGIVISVDSSLTIPTGKVGIGTTTPAEKLDVAGTAQVTGIKMPTGATNGYVLTTNALGVGTWQAPTGGGGGSFLPLAGGTMTGAITNTGNPAITMGKGNFGTGNLNPGAGAFVAGTNNRARGDYAVVNGGGGATAADSNSANASYSTIGGGQSNTASSANATVGGGFFNFASDTLATVSGGTFNTASNNFATVGGGAANTASGDKATVGGGIQNTASDSAATVSGGYINTSSGTYATVGGGFSNEAIGKYATVGGGGNSAASADFATVSGGTLNNAIDSFATVAGGRENTASSVYANVSGGINNTASGPYATVGGGRDNSASVDYATVGGGDQNIADGGFATIGGGAGNSASGYGAVVPGGTNCEALGLTSFAAGTFAKALHHGSFVWSSTSGGFLSTGDNQFLISASGGVGIGINNPNHPLHMASGAHVTAGGTWTNASSREYKTDIRPLENEEYTEILKKLEDLDVVYFRYKAEPDVEHIGMIAEDVPEEMASPDRKGIPTADAIAFLMAAVKAQQSEIEQLKATVKELKKNK